MHKTVQNIIAAARILIRRPSEHNLASDDLRFVLHNILDELNSSALKRNRDYFTDDEVISLTYDDVHQWYNVALTVSEKLEFYPVHLRYQHANSDPDKDPWYTATRVKIAQFPNESYRNVPIYAVLEKRVATVEDPISFKINLSQEFVSEQSWRLIYRLFPTDVLGFTDTVPFPAEHTALLEYFLAAEALGIVNDSSPQWLTYVQMRTPQLTIRKLELRKAYEDWIDRDVENIILNSPSYHYIRNNPQMKGRIINIRTESS